MQQLKLIFLTFIHFYRISTFFEAYNSDGEIMTAWTA